MEELTLRQTFSEIRHTNALSTLKLTGKAFCIHIKQVPPKIRSSQLLLRNLPNNQSASASHRGERVRGGKRQGGREEKAKINESQVVLTDDVML